MKRDTQYSEKNPHNPVYRWRLAQRLSVAACARKIGVAPNAWNRWEYGTIPRDVYRDDLAAMLGIPRKKLLRDLWLKRND